MDSMLHNFNMLCTNKKLIHNGSNIWLTSLFNVLHKIFPLIQQGDFITAAPDKHREPDEIIVKKSELSMTKYSHMKLDLCCIKLNCTQWRVVDRCKICSITQHTCLHSFYGFKGGQQTLFAKQPVHQHVRHLKLSYATFTTPSPFPSCLLNLLNTQLSHALYITLLLCHPRF